MIVVVVVLFGEEGGSSSCVDLDMGGGCSFVGGLFPIRVSILVGMARFGVSHLLVLDWSPLVRWALGDSLLVVVAVVFLGWKGREGKVVKRERKRKRKGDAMWVWAMGIGYKKRKVF